MAEEKVTRNYARAFTLKYGCNPHQNPAAVYSLEGSPLPFKVLNGTPGYINLLDAINAWQLVKELKEATGLAAAASFKHVSPAGAAVAVPLSELDMEVYDCKEKSLSDSAVAYLRARQADPMCSFGDFAALSDRVDAATAAVLKTEVSDGIIAPGFDDDALAVLKAKKNGAYIVLEADASLTPPDMEYREVGGMVFAQRRNATVFGPAHHLANVVTDKKELSPEAKRDLTVASIAIKYTQSNSVGYARDGQMVGVGAGQQSRVDCVKLAGRKADTWYLRRHPKVRGLAFKAGTKKVDRVNARVRYIEGDFAAHERAAWESLFETVPPPLTDEDKASFLATMSGVALASDAFFPFRDSIDAASRRGVAYVAEAGGSVADKEVIQACNEYGMVMAFTGLRLFHH